MNENTELQCVGRFQQFLMRLSNEQLEDLFFHYVHRHDWRKQSAPYDNSIADAVFDLIDDILDDIAPQLK